MNPSLPLDPGRGHEDASRCAGPAGTPTGRETTTDLSGVDPGGLGDLLDAAPEPGEATEVLVCELRAVVAHVHTVGVRDRDRLVPGRPRSGRATPTVHPAFDPASLDGAAHDVQAA